MAEPSVKNMNGQIQQNARTQTASQPQSLHPMASGGGYMPPLPPLPTLPIQGNSSQGYSKSKEITVNMSKFSLIGIAFCLMILGALTFLGGFLVGMWFAGPSTPYISTTMNDISRLGLLPNQQRQPIPQNTVVPSQASEAPPSLTNQAGTITQATVAAATAPNVPSFLAPLVTATQTAAGQQLGYKVQQQVNRRTGQGEPTAPRPQPSAPPEYQRTMPYTQNGPSSSTQPFEQTLPTTIREQKGMPPISPTSEGSTPLSQGTNEGYTIQLGVYASKDNASALVHDLQALNFIAHVSENKASDGTPLYSVHSGHYKDYTTALEAASHFASQNIPGAIIVKVSQKNVSAS
jgi:cell division septation protein DedD